MDPIPCYGGESPEEWLIWKDKLLKALVLDGQGISKEPERHILTVCLLTDDTKATFN